MPLPCGLSPIVPERRNSRGCLEGSPTGVRELWGASESSHRRNSASKSEFEMWNLRIEDSLELEYRVFPAELADALRFSPR